MSRYFLITLAALAAAGSLTGCNIVRGVGEDMAAVGRTLSKTADRSGHSGSSHSSEDYSSNSPVHQTAADPAADYDYGWEN